MAVIAYHGWDMVSVDRKRLAAAGILIAAVFGLLGLSSWQSTSAATSASTSAEVSAISATRTQTAPRAVRGPLVVVPLVAAVLFTTLLLAGVVTSTVRRSPSQAPHAPWQGRAPPLAAA